MSTIVNTLWVRPKFIISIILGVILYFSFSFFFIASVGTKVIFAWDIGVLFHTLAILFMMKHSNHDKITSRAQIQAEGQGFILLLSCLATLISIAAVISELFAYKASRNYLQLGHLALVAGTICLSWVFIHTIFCLHYAHAYYRNICSSRPGGLLFPGKEMPDYFDFLYFSFVIGTSGQTADVSIADKHIRRTGTLQCILAYTFNTIVLALAVNMISGLF